MQTKRAALLWALVYSAFLGFSAPALAADPVESLEHAINLFENGDYLAAQEELMKIDWAQLTPSQQKTRDDYLNRAQVALMMYERAIRDLEDAETAIAENEIDRARELLDAVAANEYAPGTVKQAAAAQQRQLTSGVRLAVQEREQTEPVEVEVQTQPSLPPGVTPEDEARARALTTEGFELLRNGQFNEADQRFNAALDAVPGYPEAIDGLRELTTQQEVTSGDRAQALLDRIRREDEIRWQRTVAEYRDVERQIRGHVDDQRFEEANQALVRARQLVEAGRPYADPIAKYESLRNEVEVLSEFVRAAEREYHERQVAETLTQIEEQRAARLRADAENRRRQVEHLMAQAMQHRKDGDLDAAIAVLNQVRIIDPRYQPAQWMLDDLEELSSLRKQRAVRDQFYEQSVGALTKVEEAKIPWHQELLYPDDWPEIVARRSPLGSSSPDSRIFAALDKAVRPDFVNEPFDQLVTQLAAAHNLNIIVNWNDLKAGGVDRTVPIDLSLPAEISLRKALTEVIEQAGSTGGADEIGFEVNEGVVKIATRKTLDKETFTAVYDINDLLMDIPNFADSPMRDLKDANRQPAAPAGADLSSPSWQRTDDEERADNEPRLDPERHDRLMKIIQLIQDTVAPESWRDRGGTVGTIAEINGQLVITQNSAAQRAIDNLLGKLREQRAIQIAVEARFIVVSSHYLEEMGIDIDLILNAGNAGYDYVPGTGGGALTDPVLGQPLLLPRTFSRLGFTPNTPAVGTAIPAAPAAAGNVAQPFVRPFLVPQNTGGSGSYYTPVPVRNNILGFTDPAGLGSDVPGSFAGNTIGPAFSLFGSFLDNIQVDFLIRATQADSRTTVLTAPQLVLFNGQRSWVAVTIQQNFVSTLNPVVQQGAVAQAPVIGTIDSGAVLDVNATVTSDRKYVTLTVRPGVTRLLDLQTIPFSGGAAGGGFGGGGTALTAFVQLPTLSSQRIQTTVSVPDGGTLLLGGQKLASETEIESGVPVLSKIPILKRAYSSRAALKDEQILLILIKPKILIQTEQEELAFPAFTRP